MIGKVLIFFLLAHSLGYPNLYPQDTIPDISNDPFWNSGDGPPPTDNIGTKIKNPPLLSLEGFEIGYYTHSKAKTFCLAVMSQVENIEHQKDKIIYIQITGWADGGKNGGVILGNEIIPCMSILEKKYSPDEKLAQMRACMVRDILSKMLDNKNYFINVKINEAFNDIKDDKTKISPKLRKVDALITFIDKKKKK